MQFGNLAWIVGWTGVSVLLAFIASIVGPGPIDRPSDPVVMIRMEAGPFTMGAESDWPDERPVHQVELGAFEIDQQPVVNAQFAAFLNQVGGVEGPNGLLYDLNVPSARIWQVGERFATEPGYEQYPVTAETWQGARAFCDSRGARLPTEAEWERAARGTAGRTYPWGNEQPDSSRARFAMRLLEYVPVGSYPAGATPDGVQDMAGNVWQWTSSLYRPYPYRADDGREDPNASGERVTRGGGPSSNVDMIRSTFRNVGMTQMPPGGRPPITFRCVRDAS